jgi:hypothetical protein
LDTAHVLTEKMLALNRLAAQAGELILATYEKIVRLKMPIPTLV